MAVGRVGRGLMAPMLLVNFVVCMIVLGLASWSLDKYIDNQQNHPHLGGNAATTFMLVFALAGGVIGVISVVGGMMHRGAWRSASLASAASLASISWGTTAIAFGFAWKEIRMQGHRGKRLQTLELFIIISTAVQLLYLVLLHAGMFNRSYGPVFRKYGNHDIPLQLPASASTSAQTES